jgi:hypothetical protein
MVIFNSYVKLPEAKTKTESWKFMFSCKMCHRCILMSTQTMVIDSDRLGMDRHFSRTWTSKSPPGKLALERKECPASTSTWLWVQVSNCSSYLFGVAVTSLIQTQGASFLPNHLTHCCSHSHLSHFTSLNVGFTKLGMVSSWFVGLRHYQILIVD